MAEPLDPLGAVADQWRIILVVNGEGIVVLHAEPTRAAVPCPVCGQVSRRRHSRYERRPLDLPWRGVTVRLRVRARRWFCDVPTCPRRIFAERFAGTLAWYARRTDGATRLLRSFAHQAGGEGGARLARQVGLPVSPDTLLRLLQRCAPGAAPTPFVLGVDEFALRRGQRYGLILVNLETHRPIDVLADQEAATLAAWLRQHPGVGIVARDRGPHLREGVLLGAPGAMQVVDRFHLLRNVVDALDALQRQRRRSGSAASHGGTPSPPPAEASSGAPAEPVCPPPWAVAPIAPAARQPSPRVGPLQWERARAGRAEGRSIRAIGRELGLTHKTVRRLLARPQPPPQEYLHFRPVPKAVRPFLSYLQQRWLEGCRNGRQLTRELEQRGYQGSGSSLRWLLARWRPPRPPPAARRPHLLRQHVRWLLLRAPTVLKDEERPELQRVLTADPVLAHGYDLVQQFRALLRARDLPGFEAWLQCALTSGLKPFQSLAVGMRSDLDAIRNAFRSPWSTGPVEGAITRVKLVKRQGYGRATIPLLRARVLAAN